MLQISDYQEKLKAIGIDGFKVEASNEAEAKDALLKCREFQKELRQLKRSISMDVKEIRVEYSQKIANASSTVGTVFSLFGKRGVGRSLNADAKRDMTYERDKVIEPYENLKLYIDSLLNSLDRGKTQIEAYIAKCKAMKSNPPPKNGGFFCVECGAEHLRKHKFCPECGTKVE